MSAQRSKHSWAFTALLAVSSLLLGILLCEFVLRKSGYLRQHYLVPDKPFITVDRDPRIRYSLMPGYRGNPTFYFFREYENTFPAVGYEINEQGFRGPNWLPLDEEAYRIAVVGDSMAFGIGVEDDEAFPALIEIGLNRWVDQQGIATRFRVYNLGVPGYNIEQQYFTFLRWAPEIRPDLVIQAYYFNDCDGPLRYALGTPIREFEQTFPSHLLFLLNVLRSSITALAPKDAAGQSWEACSENIEQLNEQIARTGARHIAFQLLKMLHIDGLRLTKPGQQTELTRQLDLIEGKFRSDNVEYVDVVEVLKRQPSYDLMLPDYEHPNAQAHAIIANVLVRVISENLARTMESQPEEPTVVVEE